MNIVDPNLKNAARRAHLEASQFARNDVDVAISELWRALKNHFPTIITVIFLAMAAAFSYLSVREPTYRSTATLIIDPARPNILASQQVTELQTIDSGVVDSAVEIIRSDFIAANVVRRLSLADDPQFTRETGIRKLLQPFRDMFQPRNTIDASQAERSAVVSILRDLDVRRIGLTYVVQITAQSLNPEKSAKIANSFIDAYLDNQLSVKLDMTKRASQWLETRTEELRQKVIETDNAVQRYRSESGLVETEGKLPLEQQLSELTSKLSAARADQTAARVKAESIGNLIAQGDFSSAAITAPADSRVRKLRETLGELENRERDIAERVGKEHRLTTEAHTQVEAALAALQKEVKGYHDSLQNDIASTSSQVSQLETELKNLTAEQLNLGERSIRLRELERDASSVRQLYETFLARLKEIRQQETLAMQDARIIASATPATTPSNVSGTLVLAGAIGVGILLGMVMAILKDRFDPRIRTVRDAEAATGHRVLASLPDMKHRSRTESLLTTASRLTSPAKSGRQRKAADGSLVSYGIDYPFSTFAESFRQLRLALNYGSDRRGKIVGVIATREGEGKSTVASNLAHQYAAHGTRTILIDCDLRQPSLSEQLCQADTYGLPDVLTGAIAWQSATQVNPANGLAVLSGFAGTAGGNSSELLMLPTFQELLEELSAAYEVIILDFAPTGLVSDARAAASLVDTFLLVISCGLATKSEVNEALQESPEIQEKVLGLVLNRAPTRRSSSAYPAKKRLGAGASVRAGLSQ